MTALPDWMVRSGEGLTVAGYEALPEEVSRQIEIVDGAVVVSPSPRRAHQHMNRRPDVVVYDASLPDDEVLRPEHCVLVIEIMSEGSVTTDQIDEPGEYAASGIPHFWRVEYDERVVNVFRYQLDPMTRTYALVGLDKGKLVINDPVELVLDLETLR